MTKTTETSIKSFKITKKNITSEEKKTKDKKVNKNNFNDFKLSDCFIKIVFN